MQAESRHLKRRAGVSPREDRHSCLIQFPDREEALIKQPSHVVNR